MPVNGKSKGSSFERKMANMLSERFAAQTGIQQSFRRNSDSGSFFGGSNMRRTETHDLEHAFFGDLICPKDFKFSVECKFYKEGPTFAAIVKGKITQWDTWIAQAKQDATNSQKDMLLIMKYNGVEELAFVENMIPVLNMVLPYSNVYGYRLADLLGLPDIVFFNHGSTETISINPQIETISK